MSDAPERESSPQAQEPPSPPEDLEQPAPQGAVCGEHPERQAYFTCPRCGGYACVFCWHPSVRRCHACIRRDPTEAAPPIPWESEEALGGFERYWRTLATALRPIKSAPAFARRGVGPALRFMLLSALPLVVVSGIIPHTRTLLFSGQMQVQLIGQPSVLEIVLDVLRAIAVEVGSHGVELACLYLPFTSLIRAYAPPEKRHAAAKVVLYRLWLMVLISGVAHVGSWALLPPEPGPLVTGVLQDAFLILSALMPAMMFISMGGVARLACGLSLGMTLLVVLVPMVLWTVVLPLTGVAVEVILPPVPQLE